MIAGFHWSRLRLAAWLAAAGLGLVAFNARADLWRTGYYPAWEQAGMPASSIDFAALTHVIHFSLAPNADGTVNDTSASLTAANSSDLVTRAHAAGVQVLVCVGGAGTESAFQAATASNTLPVFIQSLTNFVASRNYDGVDIDWEPLPFSDSHQFTNLVAGLRSALNGLGGHKLLTAAVGAYPPYGDSPAADYQMFASLQGQFDQINIMTYDLSGPYSGWVTWFNSPIYDGGYRFPSSGGLVPSLDAAVGNFLTNGVAPAKLAIAVAFYGYVWTGGTGPYAWSITQPRQTWTTAPTTTSVRYSDIMSGYYRSNAYNWDATAQAAYLSLTNANPTNNAFVSYDDPRTCQAKISYARNHKLGGIMLWELAQDHTPGSPDPLLEAVKQALATPGSASLQPSGRDISLSFTGAALGAYQVQWTSNLAGGTWNPLVTTNVAGSGGPVQVRDPGVITNQTDRFYRVRTPP